MKRFRTAVIVLGVLVLATVWGLAYLFTDDLVPGDTDVFPVRAPIPDEENGYDLFTDAAENAWPSPLPIASEFQAFGEKADLVLDVLSRRVWDDEVAAGILEQNAEVLALYDAGMARPHLQFPEDMGLAPLVDASAFGWARLMDVVALRAARLGAQGDEEAAFAEALCLLEFGHRIEHGQGHLTAYLRGPCAKGEALRLLRDLAGRTSVGSGQLKAHARRVAAYRVDPEALADAFRCEHERLAHAAGAIKRGEIDCLLNPTEHVGRAAGQFCAYLIQPNRTRRMAAAAFRTYIDNVPRHYADIVPVNHPVPDPLRLRDLLSPNAFGRLLYGFAQGLESALELKCCENVDVGATGALLAMRAFKAENGRLPRTLDELVPDYLDAVPVDDFDGSPLRYSPEKRALYSVGSDLADGGGASKAEWLQDERREYEERGEPFDGASAEADLEPWDLPDPSFPIEF